MLFIYPFMTSVQEISARLGRVTGRGIAGNIRHLCPRWILYGIVGLLFANISNIGADIGATGAAANLLTGGSTLIYCLLFTFVIGRAADLCALQGLFICTEVADPHALLGMAFSNLIANFIILTVAVTFNAQG